MNAQVVTVSSRIPTEPYYRPDAFIASLARFAETPTILGADTPWQGLMTKPFLYRDWLRAGNNTSDRLILCDAWDILFLAHPHGIGDRCVEWFGEDTVVTNGERNIWPRGDLADAFPDTGPWRYLNSGFMCGSAAQILALLESMDLESVGVDRRNADDTDWIYPNDQGEFQVAYTKQAVPMVVDGSCKLAMTFSATGQDDYELRDRVLHNKLTGTTPGVGHFNGDGMNNHFARFLEHWGLP
jgi:hypothetical protein